jgi:hypothetical protein
MLTAAALLHKYRPSFDGGHRAVAIKLQHSREDCSLHLSFPGRIFINALDPHVGTEPFEQIRVLGIGLTTFSRRQSIDLVESSLNLA